MLNNFVEYFNSFVEISWILLNLFGVWTSSMFQQCWLLLIRIVSVCLLENERTKVQNNTRKSWRSWTFCCLHFWPSKPPLFALVLKQSLFQWGLLLIIKDFSGKNRFQKSFGGTLKQERTVGGLGSFTPPLVCTWTVSQMGLPPSLLLWSQSRACKEEDAPSRTNPSLPLFSSFFLRNCVKGL